MNIDARLRAIINEISGHTLVDVGCDHGIVTCAALEEGKVKNAIACDISDKSLDKARNLAKLKGLSNVEFRCGDGLCVIKDNEADTIVIAGMGGQEIIKILSSVPKGVNKLVLCPHTNVIEVRYFLSQNGYKEDKDFVVLADKHFYSIIVATKGDEKLTKKQLFLGKNSKEDKTYIEYLEYLNDKYSQLLNKVTGDTKEKYTNYLKIIKSELNEG